MLWLLSNKLETSKPDNFQTSICNVNHWVPVECQGQLFSHEVSVLRNSRNTKWRACFVNRQEPMSVASNITEFLVFPVHLYLSSDCVHASTHIVNQNRWEAVEPKDMILICLNAPSGSTSPSRPFQSLMSGSADSTVNQQELVCVILLLALMLGKSGTI